MELPIKYKEMIGTKQLFSGNVFSSSQIIKEEEYEVLDVRMGRSFITNIAREYKHPTFELLIKKTGMMRARWTKCFPIKEINLLHPKQ